MPSLLLASQPGPLVCLVSPRFPPMILACACRPVTTSRIERVSARRQVSGLRAACSVSAVCIVPAPFDRNLTVGCMPAIAIRMHAVGIAQSAVPRHAASSALFHA